MFTADYPDLMMQFPIFYRFWKPPFEMYKNSHLLKKWLNSQLLWPTPFIHRPRIQFPVCLFSILRTSFMTLFCVRAKNVYAFLTFFALHHSHERTHSTCVAKRLIKKDSPLFLEILLFLKAWQNPVRPKHICYK